MEISTDSSSCSQQPHLPPGFRFHPTDEELVVHYLKRKAASAPLPVSIIAEVDLYKYDPWELPGKASFGENEWYFFSPRDRKYPNGARPNRAATSGYWKATGTDKPIRATVGNKVLGVKKALVFYGGKPPKGVKTNWIMHEYRLAEGGSGSKGGGGGLDCRSKKLPLRLDDWVLCRIYQKHAAYRSADHDTLPDTTAAIAPPCTVLLPFMNNPSGTDKNTSITTSHNVVLTQEETFFEGLITTAPELSLVVPDGNRALGGFPCFHKATRDDDGSTEGCGQIGGYFHHPMMGAYHISGINWST